MKVRKLVYVIPISNLLLTVPRWCPILVLSLLCPLVSNFVVWFKTESGQRQMFCMTFGVCCNATQIQIKACERIGATENGTGSQYDF